MDTTIFNDKHILFDQTSKTQDEAFLEISKFAYQNGYVSDKQAYYEGLKEREAKATTGFKGHIAIPHSKNSSVLKPGLFLVKFAHEIPWNALDNLPVHVALVLTIPVDGAEQHLKILSSIARRLIDEDFRKNILNESDKKKLTTLIKTI